MVFLGTFILYNSYFQTRNENKIPLNTVNNPATANIHGSRFDQEPFEIMHKNSNADIEKTVEASGVELNKKVFISEALTSSVSIGLDQYRSSNPSQSGPSPEKTTENKLFSDKDDDGFEEKFFYALDKDGDMVISYTEYNGPKSFFDLIDVDKDEFIKIDEYNAFIDKINENSFTEMLPSPKKYPEEFNKDRKRLAINNSEQYEITDFPHPDKVNMDEDEYKSLIDKFKIYTSKRKVQSPKDYPEEFNQDRKDYENDDSEKYETTDSSHDL